MAKKTTAVAKLPIKPSGPMMEAGRKAKAYADKADKAAQNYEDYCDSAAASIKSARKLGEAEGISGSAFEKFITKTVGMGRTRMYEVLAIADGSTTKAELLKKGADRAARHQKKLKAAAALVDAEPVEDNETVKGPKPASVGSDLINLPDFISTLGVVWANSDTKADFEKQAQKVIVGLFDDYEVHYDC